MSSLDISTNKNTWKESLLRKFSTWAAKYDVMEDPYVLNLIKDITEDRNISFWANEDPAKLLPLVDTKEGQRIVDFGKFLTTIRNMLVFLPVAVTWKAVSDATTGFAEFVSTNNATPVNFLEFWQNGYGYLDQFWTIGSIAEFDFWIIMLVIVISLFSNIMQNRGQRMHDVAFDELEKEKISLAIEIKKYLYNAKPVDNTSITQDVIVSIEKLNQGIREYNKISQNIETLSDDLIRVVPQLQNLQESMNKIGISNNTDLEKVLSSFTNQMNSSVVELNNFVDQLNESISSVSNLLNTSLTSSVGNMTKDIDDSNSIIKKSARQLEKELKNLTKEINSSLEKLKNQDEN
jgi:uncharacterized protein YukE